MNDDGPEPSWRELLVTAAIIFLIAAAGCTAAFALWRQELNAAQIVVLGSGDRLSLLVTDGPARLVLATGNDAIGYENALNRVRPLFARRVDLLLVAGAGDELLVPAVAAGDPYVRTVAAFAPLPSSPASEVIGRVAMLEPPRRIRLGPSVSVTIETAAPLGADPDEGIPAWRATIERGQTRVVALSDGDAAPLFPPVDPAAVLIVAGPDPVAAWETSPAVALVTNARAIEGPELREAFATNSRAPRWAYRVFPNEALRLALVPGGIALPSESAMTLGATESSLISSPSPIAMGEGSRSPSPIAMGEGVRG